MIFYHIGFLALNYQLYSDQQIQILHRPPKNSQKVADVIRGTSLTPENLLISNTTTQY